MKNLLDIRLADNRAAHRSSLAMFLTAGFPTKPDTLDLLKSLEGGGADVIEVGMPFSDPLADGPVIQRASERALQNGATLAWTLEQVAAFRSVSDLPVVLMGYLNPILRYGPGRFFRDSASAGVNGIILPEVPLIEWPRFAPEVHRAGLCSILLVTPTTEDSQVRAIDEFSSGFVYCVSTTGVTGGDTSPDAVRRIREVASHIRKNPILVGFGISTPERAVEFSTAADGVIVGSALLRKVDEGCSPRVVEAWVRGYRTALDHFPR